MKALAPTQGLVAPAVEARAPLPQLPNNTDVILGSVVNPHARDRLDALPPASKERLLALKDHAEELRGSLRAIQFDYDDARAREREAFMELQAREAQLRLSVPPFTHDVEGWLDEQPDLVALREKHVRLDADATRRKPRIAALSEKVQAAGRLKTNCERWLEDQSGDLLPYDYPTTRGRKTENIETIRDKITSLKEQIADAKAAPLPSGDAKTAANQFVDKLARAGTPDVGYTLFHGSEPTFTGAYGQVFNSPGTTVKATDALALVAAMFPDRMKELLGEEIDRRADDDNALSVTAKAKRIADLEAAILDNERSELLLLDANPDIEPREDMSVRAFLALA
jgi:hypothetical protein